MPILIGCKYKHIYGSIGPSLAYHLHQKIVWKGDIDKTSYLRDNSNTLGSVEFNAGVEVNIGYVLPLNEKFDLLIEGGLEKSNIKNENSSRGHYYYNYEFGLALNWKL